MRPNVRVDAAANNQVTVKLSITDSVVPLASNDLFGGVPLGQHATAHSSRATIQAPSAVSRVVTTPSYSPRNAEALALSKHGSFVSRGELNHATLSHATVLQPQVERLNSGDTLEHLTSDYQTGKIVGQRAAERLS